MNEKCVWHRNVRVCATRSTDRRPQAHKGLSCSLLHAEHMNARVYPSNGTKQRRQHYTKWQSMLYSCSSAVAHIPLQWAIAYARGIRGVCFGALLCAMRTFVFVRFLIRALANNNNMDDGKKKKKKRTYVGSGRPGVCVCASASEWVLCSAYLFPLWFWKCVWRTLNYFGRWYCSVAERQSICVRASEHVAVSVSLNEI